MNDVKVFLDSEFSNRTLTNSLGLSTFILTETMLDKIKKKLKRKGNSYYTRPKQGLTKSYKLRQINTCKQNDTLLKCCCVVRRETSSFYMHDFFPQSFQSRPEKFVFKL